MAELTTARLSAADRAVRVGPGPASRVAGVEALVVAPLDASAAGGEAPPDEAHAVLVDGERLEVGLEPRGPDRARISRSGAPASTANVVFIGPPIGGPDGVVRQEVLVDGWRVEVELEPERRATLRERARRAGEAAGHGGPTEVRSVFPGRVVSVAVAPGDEVAAGQPMLVVEAMKMQNELRSPRAGTVARVDVGPGVTVEVGDLLVAIE